jgi:uncharacterized protein YndB with AHSA1/START domain
MPEGLLRQARASVVVAAPPEKAFDAWLDPEIAARFLIAGENEASDVTIDPREGGAFEVVMRAPGRSIHHHGRYVVIDRPRTLVFTWISAGTEHQLSLVTVTFTPVAGGVRVDLVHEGLPGDQVAAGHERGWASIFARLADAIS